MYDLLLNFFVFSWNDICAGLLKTWLITENVSYLLNCAYIHYLVSLNVNCWRNFGWKFFVQKKTNQITHTYSAGEFNKAKRKLWIIDRKVQHLFTYDQYLSLMSWDNRIEGIFRNEHCKYEGVLKSLQSKPLYQIWTNDGTKECFLAFCLTEPRTFQHLFVHKYLTSLLTNLNLSLQKRQDVAN